ncbi:MAG TPA: efflux RND transporter periplasmic adaptor subunit [Chryseosolibacter sp.]|nr:efflux RND transporter periplasmic adaptor subunit [Chryseosolibacter sp.]
MIRYFTITIIFLSLMSCGNGAHETRPQVKTLVEAVYSSGFVVAKNQYQIIAQVDGYVIDKLADDGDQIKKGDPIYIIASEQQSARNRIAQQAFTVAQKNYRDNSPVLLETLAAIRSRKLKKEFDSVNHVRYTNLWNRKATTKAEYDRARLAYENSTNEYQQYLSRYEKIKDQLTTEFISARNNLVAASDESGKYIVRSEVDGAVYMTSKEPGEMIRRGEVIAVAGSGNGFYFQLNVDELDVQKIKPGQEVIVKIDAYPDKLIHASILKVYPLVDRRTQSVRVDAEPEETLPGNFSGLALEANIIIRRKQEAIVIPKQLLLPGDSLLISEGGDEKIVKITTGISTFEEIEILEGIDSNTVILNPKKDQ